jgi:hypothetical protein
VYIGGEMSLDVYLYHTEDGRGELHWGNITHNLTGMAYAVGLYKPLWHPEDINVSKAKDLIQLLEMGLMKLHGLDKKTIEENTPENGWGSYEGLVLFVENYLDACREFPNAYVKAEV